MRKKMLIIIKITLKEIKYRTTKFSLHDLEKLLEGKVS